MGGSQCAHTCHSIRAYRIGGLGNGSALMKEGIG